MLSDKLGTLYLRLPWPGRGAGGSQMWTRNNTRCQIRMKQESIYASLIKDNRWETAISQ